jgi:ribonuclease HII
MLNTGNSLIDDSEAPYIVGSDEVGFGAWAGPIAVCAVAVPREWVPPVGLTDSKELSTTQMKRIRAEFINRHAADVHWRIWWAEADVIDRDGAGPTLTGLHQKALREAAAWARVQAGGEHPLVIADGNVRVDGAIGLPKADKLVPAVSMASVLAKLARDEVMADNAVRYPGYGFERHVGYGTKVHQVALAKLGPCLIHRKSYAPIAALVKKEEPALAQGWEPWAGLPEDD